MKKYSSYVILTVLWLCTLAFNTQNSKDCAKVKNGNFYYYSKVSRDKVEVQRQGDLQLETDTKTGLALKNKIIWTGDCSYNMYINAFSENKLNKIDSLISITPALVEIIDVQSDHYVCMWKLKVLNKDLQGIDTIYFKNSQEK